jgi:phage repressor protein C with HTH and peptisase S24 domain
MQRKGAAAELGLKSPSLAPEVGLRVKAAAEKIGTRVDAASAGGISDDQLRRIIDGTSQPTFQTIAKLSKASGISMEWIAFGTGPMLREEGEESPQSGHISGLLANDRGDLEVVKVPIYDAHASAGPGAFVAQDQVIGHFALDSEWIRAVVGVNPARLVMTQAVGNSMEPTIFSGDRLLVETGELSRFDSAIYVFVFGGDIMVKRYVKADNGAFLLRSDNRDIADIRVDRDDQTECRLIGRVRLILRVP